MIIKWTNKISGEVGFVKSVDYKHRHFVNTFEYTEAKKFKEATAYSTIEKLIEYGEGDQNFFEVIE